MFGAVKGWKWGAAGKHPVVKDYIRLGEGSPTLDRFSRWIETGYPAVFENTGHCTWRFFARGSRRSELACGLVRDSRDGIGRIFPLLILGIGPLQSWETGWTRVPLACEVTWQSMESLCSRRMIDLDDLKGAISRLPAPSWTGGTPSPAPVQTEMPPAEKGRISLPMKDATPGEIGGLLESWSVSSNSMPEAVFIGGTIGQPCLVMFSRALNADDLRYIWNAGRCHQ